MLECNSRLFQLNLTSGYEIPYNVHGLKRESELISIISHFLQHCTCNLCWLLRYSLAFHSSVSLSPEGVWFNETDQIWYSQSCENKMQCIQSFQIHVSSGRKKEKRHGAFQNIFPSALLTLVVWITNWQICMLCYVHWVYITYGIAFNTNQNLDIKKQPVEIGLKAQVLQFEMLVTWK